MPSTRTVPHVTLRGACKVCRRSRLSFPWRQMQCLFDWMTKSHAASRRADGVFTNLSSPMFTPDVFLVHNRGANLPSSCRRRCDKMIEQIEIRQHLLQTT